MPEETTVNLEDTAPEVVETVEAIEAAKAAVVDDKPKAKAKAAPKAAKAEPKADAPVRFRSRGPEMSSFRFMGQRPVRNPQFPHLNEWFVPADLVERAMAHHHFRTGRITKASE